MKVRIRKTGTQWVIFEGEVKSTIFTDQTVPFQWLSAGQIEDGISVELSVLDYVYPHIVAGDILYLHGIRNDIEASVFQALDNMRTNGYKQQPVILDEAEELINEDANLEQCKPKDLVPYINRWRIINGG